MAKEEFDASIFNSADEMQEAQAMFESGQKAPDNPVGTFQAALRESTLGRSQSSNKLMITHKLEILVGEHKGYKLNKYDGLGSEKQVKITLDQLKRLGIDTKKLSFDKLPATLLTLKDMNVSIQCKQNGEYYNIYFLKAIKSITPQTTAPGAPAASGSRKF